MVSEVKGAIQIILAFANAGSDLIILNNQVLASNPISIPCDNVGGLSTVALTGLNPISMGDQLSVDFANCVDTGTTINGNFTGSYTTINELVAGEAGNVASANDWDFVITGSSDNLRVTDGNIDAAADGDTTATVAFAAAGVDLTSTATNSILTFAGSGGECASIENANIVSTAMNVTTNPAMYTVNVNPAAALLVASTEFAGTVTAQTPATPFSGMENLYDVGAVEIDKYFVELDDTSPPTGGVLVITGDTSSITMTAMAGGVVQIDVDEDGVAGFEATIMTTWGVL
ncbi:MAG: hypothetical protein GKR92_11130 [Gammaproteobacteria bacterium]|nr:MAG: hypothetical protein GKR92_11130 [Gammaproteobacteria bacterium]